MIEDIYVEFLSSFTFITLLAVAAGTTVIALGGASKRWWLVSGLIVLGTAIILALKPVMWDDRFIVLDFMSLIWTANNFSEAIRKKKQKLEGKCRST